MESQMISHKWPCFLLKGRGRKQYKKSENESEKFAKLNFPAMNNALNRFLGAIQYLGSIS